MFLNENLTPLKFMKIALHNFCMKNMRMAYIYASQKNLSEDQNMGTVIMAT